MTYRIDRRALIVGGAAAVAASGHAGLAQAQAKPNLRFSAVFSEQDIRAEMMKRFGEAIKEDFTLQPYYGGNLFKQGTELVAMQRNNLEMGNIAPQDVSNQIPAWSILTSGYLLRDADHLKKVFASDVGVELKKMAEEKLNIRIKIKPMSARPKRGERGAQTRREICKFRPGAMCANEIAGG